MDNIKLLSPKPGVELLAVKVPEGAHRFIILDDALRYDNRITGWPTINLPEGNWQILGLSDQLSEEVWQTLLVKGGNEAFGDLYRGAELFHTKAVEAGQAFLQANEVYTVNPYGLEPAKHFYWGYTLNLEEWQQAQANTGSWLILRSL